MKIWAYVALAGILIAAITAGVRYVDQNAYNRAVSELQEQAIEQQNEAIEKRMAEWVETQAAAEPVIIIEEKIVEKIRVVIKEIPKIVEVFVADECRDLGFEYAELLNAAVRASNQSSDTNTTVASPVVD